MEEILNAFSQHSYFYFKKMVLLKSQAESFEWLLYRLGKLPTDFLFRRNTIKVCDFVMP